jgi:D-alanyl-D-alanine carboxypeptidase
MTALLLAVGVVIAADPASALVARTPAAAGAGGVASASPAGSLKRVADEAMATGVPGVVVRVDDGHGPALTVVRQASWSKADQKLSGDDQFRMGSNTKTLTAVLVLQLVAEHRVALSDPVEKWLPGAIPNGQHITLRMLLNHTSGLADYPYERWPLDLMTGQRTDRPTPAELLTLATNLPVKFAPGQGMSYSNAGYIALGMVLEKATGHSVSDLIHDRIAKPLGLRHTYLPTGATPTGRHNQLARGYEPDASHLAPLVESLGLPAGYGFVGPNHDDRVDVTDIDQSWDGAAGAIVSTTSDWARFDAALMSGKLLPKPLLNEMRTSLPDPETGPEYGYGLGLEEYHSPCGTVWGHDGALPGYRSDNYTDETGRRTVSVLATTHFGLKIDPAADDAEAKLVDAAICTMFGKPLPTP